LQNRILAQAKSARSIKRFRILHGRLGNPTQTNFFRVSWEPTERANALILTNSDQDSDVQKHCTIGRCLRPCSERSEDQSCDQVAQGVGALRRHRVNDKWVGEAKANEFLFFSSQTQLNRRAELLFYLYNTQVKPKRIKSAVIRGAGRWFEATRFKRLRADSLISYPQVAASAQQQRQKLGSQPASFPLILPQPVAKRFNLNVPILPHKCGLHRVEPMKAGDASWDNR
jgi:hypothetical protein